MKTKRLCILALSLVLLCLSGCSAGNPALKGTAENEILTMKPVDQNKTMVTIHYEHGAADVFDLEHLIESAFPEVDIVMVHDGSNDSAYPLRQGLINGVERDILLTRSAPAIGDIAPEYLLDLSAQKFVGGYYSGSLDSCMSEDGKLYFLPGPSDIYGVVYDRTLFRENGWEVPHSYSEFTELIRTINRAGIKAVETKDGVEKEMSVKAVQPSLRFADAFQIVFNTFAYEQVYRGAENQQWLADYQSGKGSMVGHMEPAVETFKRLFDDGILSLDDMEVRVGYRSQKLYEYHSTAMIFENQNAYTNNAMMAPKDNMHEVGIFPFWTSDEPDSDYLYSIPSYYFAANKASAEESPEKEKLLLDILAFLSRPETQMQLVRDGLQLSNVIGVPMKVGDFGKEIQKTIEDGRVINTFFFAGGDDSRTVERAMRDTVSDLITGRMTTEEWLKNADTARDEYKNSPKDLQVYGKAARTFTKFETAEIVGDMYRYETGAPIALVFVGQDSEGVNGLLYAGDITDRALGCISATKMYNADSPGIAVGTLSGRQIMDFLSGKEGLVPTKWEEHIVASGLKVEYSPWNEAGNRLVSCRLPDGKELDPEAAYQVAYCPGSLKSIEADTVNPAEIESETMLEGTWEEHFISWLNGIGRQIKGPEFPAMLVWK